MLKGYRTLIVNGAVTLFGVIAYFFPGAELPSSDQVGELVDQSDAILTQADALIVAIIGVVNMILRSVTTTPPFWAKDK